MSRRINDDRMDRPHDFYAGAPQPLDFNTAFGHSSGELVTAPAPRPRTLQVATNFQITLAANIPQPLIANAFEADAMSINVPSSTGNSVFFGYGSGISITSGYEVRPGFPLNIGLDSQREIWELQRLLELIYYAISKEPAGLFRANRIVYNASDWFLVAAVQTTVAIMLFPPNDN